MKNEYVENYNAASAENGTVEYEGKERMRKELLFIKKIRGEAYKFYYDTILNFYSVETPENCFGYSDKILFTESGTPYTLYRYCPQWILNTCKNALTKKNYIK